MGLRQNRWTIQNNDNFNLDGGQKVFGGNIFGILQVDEKSWLGFFFLDGLVGGKGRGFFLFQE